MNPFIKASLLSSILLCAPSLRAQDTNTLLKDAAIASALLTYGVAAITGQELDCPVKPNIGAQAGVDRELNVASLSLARHRCTIKTPLTRKGIQLSLTPAVVINHWQADKRTGSFASSATELTLLPKASWHYPLTPKMNLELGAGIGASYLSRPTIGLRKKSTQFQFSDELSLGVSDKHRHVNLSVLYRHISNAGIRTPNNNVDFIGISLVLTP